jgi:hypothetical protein
MQAMWNWVKTMEFLELKTTAEVLRLSQASHDVVHRCGLHAPVQRSTLMGFFSRVFYAEDFKPIERDPHLFDYMHTFALENKILIYPPTPIPAIAEWRTTRSWRTIPKIRHKPMTEHWPFLHKEVAKDHLDIMMVDSLIPKGIPEQWRQDMCQDLFVAILSGEVDPDELRNGAGRYMKEVWRQHPYKYGQLSLDAPAPWGSDDVKLGDLLSNVSLADVMCGHTSCELEHKERPMGTIGDLLRHKNNGMALPDAHIEHPTLMDEEIAEVYDGEIHRVTERNQRNWGSRGN